MMVANGMERISTPWRLRWHRFRYTTLPVIGLVAFAVLTFLLWTRQGEMPHAIGEIEAIRVEVASPLGGILMPLPKPPEGRWALYETVKQDDVLAQLDDRPLQAEMATLVQELDRLKKELDAVTAKLAVSEADRGLNYMSEAVRLRVELAQRSLVVLERQAEVAVNQLEAQRRTVYYDCLKPLYDKKIVSELELNNARYAPRRGRETPGREHQGAGRGGDAEEDARVRTRARGMTIAQVPAGRHRRRSWPPSPRQSRCSRRRSTRWKSRSGRLTIRSPVHGMICAINHWPQSAVRAGDPIVTVGSDERRYLVCYVRQEQHVNPKVGMDVDVRKRAAISPTVRTVVERVGPQVEPIPVHLCRDPKMPEWGLPVRITLPKDFSGRPGELFEVTFKTHSKSNG